jgi:hypothetical protein
MFLKLPIVKLLADGEIFLIFKILILLHQMKEKLDSPLLIKILELEHLPADFTTAATQSY